jgi:hypothetical protein
MSNKYPTTDPDTWDKYIAMLKMPWGSHLSTKRQPGTAKISIGNMAPIHDPKTRKLQWDCFSCLGSGSKHFSEKQIFVLTSYSQLGYGSLNHSRYGVSELGYSRINSFSIFPTLEVIKKKSGYLVGVPIIAHRDNREMFIEIRKNGAKTWTPLYWRNCQFNNFSAGRPCNTIDFKWFPTGNLLCRKAYKGPIIEEKKDVQVTTDNKTMIVLDSVLPAQRIKPNSPAGNAINQIPNSQYITLPEQVTGVDLIYNIKDQTGFPITFADTVGNEPVFKLIPSIHPWRKVRDLMSDPSFTTPGRAKNLPLGRSRVANFFEYCYITSAEDGLPVDLIFKTAVGVSKGASVLIELKCNSSRWANPGHIHSLIQEIIVQ